MTSRSSRCAVPEIGTLFRFGVTGGLTDHQLLNRYMAGPGDDAEDAFAVLVERHGPMVLGVCRRILPDFSDAEDAFQATFLVLVRKARQIARRELLANWLYGVALRTAREVRKNTARRQARERQVDAMVRRESPRDEPGDELRAVLDEELSRLPASFRSTVVLCDLEGKTHKEAARLLDVPVGTVSSRLVRARSLLRQRLTRRLALSAGSVAAALAREAAAAAVPPTLAASAIRAAVQIASGGTSAGAVSASVTAVTEGVLKSMMIAKLTAKGPMILTALVVMLSIATTSWVMATARGGRPRSHAGGAATDDPAASQDWAWVDQLHNADAATKRRLKLCASSAASNYAAVRQAVFDYELRRDLGHIDPEKKETYYPTRTYRGKVYWRDGSVRYDYHGPDAAGKVDPQGRLLPGEGESMTFSVIRTEDMLAYMENQFLYGISLVVDAPPDRNDWGNLNRLRLSHLDPSVFYASNFRGFEPSSLRAFCESLRAIESEEKGDTILIRFICNNANNGRVEIECDKSVAYLPVRSRGGDVREGKYVIIAEMSCEWRNTDQVWFPAHYVETSHFGFSGKPIKEFDLTVHNLRVNGAAEIPDNVFTLSTTAVPDGAGGTDNRNHLSLIKAGGVIRERRLTDKLKMRPIEPVNTKPVDPKEPKP